MEKHQSDITITVELDENKVAEKLSWKADNAGMKGKEEAKAMLLALWDDKNKEALRIDLWTKDMTMDDMKKFFHQTLASMADTLERATNETEIAQDLRDFSLYFAEQMKLIQLPESDN